VLPVAIDKYVQVGIEKSHDDLVHVKSESFGEFTFDSKNISATDSWKDYVMGIFDVLKKDKGVNFPGLKLEIKSNVPEGAGLSSSAALEVAVITALNGFLNLNLTDEERYNLSQKAENEFVGVQCGIMDQFASVMGRKGHALFLDTVSMKYEYVRKRTSEGSGGYPETLKLRKSRQGIKPKPRVIGNRVRSELRRSELHRRYSERDRWRYRLSNDRRRLWRFSSGHLRESQSWGNISRG